MIVAIEWGHFVGNYSVTGFLFVSFLWTRGVISLIPSLPKKSRVFPFSLEWNGSESAYFCFSFLLVEGQGSDIRVVIIFF